MQNCNISCKLVLKQANSSISFSSKKLFLTKWNFSWEGSDKKEVTVLFFIILHGGWCRFCLHCSNCRTCTIKWMVTAILSLEHKVIDPTGWMQKIHRILDKRLLEQPGLNRQRNRAGIEKGNPDQSMQPPLHVPIDHNYKILKLLGISTNHPTQTGPPSAQTKTSDRNHYIKHRGISRQR